MSSHGSNRTKRRKGPRYTVTCRCGNTMKVKTKHFGRMCRCTKCDFPIYVTYDSVSPPVDKKSDVLPRYFAEDEVPIRWEVGDLITELYEVKAILGEGGMGTVYKLEHRGWDKLMAVKCPSGSLNRDPIWAEQYEHECETWINLSPHPNVVECYYMRRMGGLPRLFAEYVDGSDLDKMIEKKTLYEGGRSEALARMLDIAIQYCWGLHHAHREGLVHQDVKPSNLLIGSDGVAKVTDFGLAMVHVNSDGSRGSGGSRGSRPSGVGSDMDGAVRGSTGGTPTYRSNDHKAYDGVTFQTDIWSWGVTMIEMFSGDVYWTDGTKAVEVLENLLRYGSRYDIVPRMPDDFQTLLRECFQDDREKRPESMEVIANRIKTIYEQELKKPYPRPDPQLEYAHVDILNNRAVSLIDLGQPAEAEALLSEVLTQEPGHIEANYNRGLLFWRRGHITDMQMLELTDKLCNAYPKEWLPRYLRAQVCMERGDCTTAEQILEPIAKDVEYHRDVAFCLAMAYHFRDKDKRRLWHFHAPDFPVSAVGINHDGRRVFAGSMTGEIRSFDVATQEQVATFRGHEQRVNSIVQSGSDALLVSGSSDGTVRTWNPGDGRLLHTFSGHEGPARKVVLSNNEKFILSGSEDGSARLWDVKSGTEIRQFRGHQGAVWSVALSHCNRYAFTGSVDGSIAQWDIASGKGMRRFTSKRNRIWSIHITPSSSQLVAACGPMIEIWDVATANLRYTIQAHQSDIFGLSVTTDGVHALSATQKGTMKVWDLRRGQCLRSLKASAPVAMTVAGDFAVSGGTHGELAVWALHLDVREFSAKPMICRDE